MKLHQRGGLLIFITALFFIIGSKSFTVTGATILLTFATLGALLFLFGEE